MFFGLAFFTLAGRSVRRSVRPLFQDRGKAMTFIYDCLTYIATRVVMAYIVFPFYLLEFWAAIEVYKQLYFFAHILGLFAIIILPWLLPMKSKK